MGEQETIEEYANSFRVLKKQYADAGISDKEFRTLYFDSLHSLDRKSHEYRHKKWFSLRNILVALVTMCIIISFRYINCLLICDLQDLIYPGLRLLRKVSIPLISLFPSLTDYYQETCLLHNPFFTLADMDCWPCSTVTNVREVSDLPPNKQQYVAPFIYETDQKVINIDMLKEFYYTYKGIFDKESPKILVNNKIYLHPNEVFQNIVSGDERNFYLWKFNSVNTARLLRQIIPRPKIVPKFGQSTERFILIESGQHSVHIPDTECSFSFILTLSGSRIVQLIPAEECKNQCKSLRVELKETYLLWYNWWYWRPVILPTADNSTFIATVGSYC